MNTKPLFYLTILFFISSCTQPFKKSNKNVISTESKLSGFWKRIGTIQQVNGVNVDTIYIKNIDPDYTQIKVFHNGNVAWIDNVYDSLNQHKSGSGMYGKFRVENDMITEIITHATGGAIGFLYQGGEKKLDSVPTKFKFVLNDDLLSYNWNIANGDLNSENEENFIELWKRLPDLNAMPSKIDGVWKRSFEIMYVNNVPVDTVSVPNDGKFDIHFRLNGRFIYQVDNTGMSSPGEEMWWGFGGYGQYVFTDKNTIMEYGEFFSGGPKTTKNPPRTVGGMEKFDFYNDDLFLQTQVDGEGNIFRGVVYGRVK